MPPRGIARRVRSGPWWAGRSAALSEGSSEGSGESWACGTDTIDILMIDTPTAATTAITIDIVIRERYQVVLGRQPRLTRQRKQIL